LLVALEYGDLAIRNFHDSGNVGIIRAPVAVLAAVLDRLGRYESAAAIAGFAFSPLTAATLPQFESAIAHRAVSSAIRPTNSWSARVTR
jgi:hypothetical protein